MPLDQADTRALPAYEQGYVLELYLRLEPAADQAYLQYFLTRTRERWQRHMRGLVTSSGDVDTTLPVYERAYVVDWYNQLRPDALLEYLQYMISRTPAEWQEQMRTLIGEGVADPDADAWRAAVIAAGGSVSDTRAHLIRNFVFAEKLAGSWALTDDYWLLAAENTQQALISLKQKRTVTPVNSPLFKVDRGYIFSGTGYLNTNFIASTHAVVMTGLSMRLAVHVRSDTNMTFYTLGVQFNATQNLAMVPRSNTVIAGSLNGSAPVALPVATSVGFSVVSRAAGGLTFRHYKNGAPLPTADAASVGTVLPAIALFIGCRNGAGAPQFYRHDNVTFACTGAPLSDAQEVAHYNNVQNLLNAIGAGTPADDTQMWVDQVVANGGTVSPARQALVRDFIAAGKAAGSWQLTDDYWLLAGENEIQALTSLKQRRLATAVATPLFKPNVGYVFNGTGYINTNFTPSLHVARMSGNDQRVACYETTETDSLQGYNFGSSTATGQQLALRVRCNGTVLFANMNAGSTAHTLPVATSRGFTAASRAGGGTTVKGYKNGVPTPTAVATTPGATLTTHAMFIGARNNVGAASGWRSCAMPLACLGASLSDAQELAQYTNVETLLAAIGANAPVDDVAAWVDQVIANGGTVSPARRTLIEQFVAAEKAAGSWQPTDDYWILAAENPIQALTSLKLRRLGTAVASPVFTADRGYTFDGVASYIATGFNPGNSAGVSTGTNNRLAAYERIDIASFAGLSMGCGSAGNLYQMIANTGTGLSNRLNASVGIIYALPAPTGLGLSAVSRNGTDVASCAAYKNGVACAFVSGAPVFTAVHPAVNLFVGAYNNNGVASSFRATQTAFAAYGAQLTAPQELAQYTNLQALLTSIGANV